MKTCFDVKLELAKLTSAIDNVTNSIKREQKELDRIDNEIARKQKAVALCKACIGEEQSVIDYLSSLVTTVLSVAFAKPVRFTFAKVTDDNGLLTGLQPMIDTGDGEGIFEDYSEAGDGYQCVASFALRMGFLFLNQDLEKIMVYDEPLKTVNPVVWQRLIDFLDELSRTMDLQFIVVTHVPCGFPVTYHISKNGVHSVAEKVVNY